MLSGLTKAPEFKFIREMHYPEELTSVDRLQETANRFYVDQQSRNASGPAVSGRGAAMAVSSSDQCHRLPPTIAEEPSEAGEEELAEQARRWWGKCSAEMVLLPQHHHVQRC